MCVVLFEHTVPGYSTFKKIMERPVALFSSCQHDVSRLFARYGTVPVPVHG